MKNEYVILTQDTGSVFPSACRRTIYVCAFYLIASHQYIEAYRQNEHEHFTNIQLYDLILLKIHCLILQVQKTQFLKLAKRKSHRFRDE